MRQQATSGSGVLTASSPVAVLNSTVSSQGVVERSNLQRFSKYFRARQDLRVLQPFCAFLDGVSATASGTTPCALLDWLEPSA